MYDQTYSQESLYRCAGRDLIGTMLRGDQEITEQVMACLEPTAFFEQDMQKLFAVMRRVHAEHGSLSVLSVENAISHAAAASRPAYTHDNLKYMAEYAQVSNCQDAIKLLTERLHRLRLDSLTETLQKIRDEQLPFDSALQAIDQFRSMRSSPSEDRHTDLTSLLKAGFDRLSDPCARTGKTGIPTGFAAIDTACDGIQPGHLILIGARPGVGKSTLALSMAINALQSTSARIWLYALEESRDCTAQRIISAVSAVDLCRIASRQITAKEYSDICEKVGDLMKSAGERMSVTHCSSLSPKALRNRLLHARQKDEMPNWIVIDHLGLMQGDQPNYQSQQAETAEISRSLKTLAMEFDISVLACAQLNRGVVEREDKRPSPADLRGSGALEQDADVIMLLHRPSYYDERQSNAQIEVNIAKNKYRPTGRIFLRWDPQHARILDLAETDQSEFD